MSKVRKNGHWEICSECNGHGASSAYLGAFTPEQLREQFDDGGEAYMNGAYDRPCEAKCDNGKVWIDEKGECEARARLRQRREDQKIADMENGYWDRGRY